MNDEFLAGCAHLAARPDLLQQLLRLSREDAQREQMSLEDLRYVFVIDALRHEAAARNTSLDALVRTLARGQRA